MKKFFTITFFLGVIIILLNSFNVLNSNPNGAPSGRTGAPTTTGFENTCAESGCHDPNLNVGPHTCEITILGDPQGYVPGDIYTVTAKIINPTGSAAGFELVCLNPFKLNAGTITQGTNNKKLVSNGKTYVTHTNKNSRSWTFDWTAPNPGPDSVTFYLAVMETVNGVFNTYTTKKTLPLAVITKVGEKENNNINVFPTQTNDKLYLNISGLDIAQNKYQILGVDGKVHQEGIINSDQIDINRELNQGNYYLKIETNRGVQTKRFSKI